MLWNNNDREEAKPTWLTLSQRINCVRTVRGWEIPLHGANVGAEFGGQHALTAGHVGGMTAFTKYMELLVAQPIDDIYNPNIVITVTGAPPAFHRGTGLTGISLTANNIAYYYDTAPGAGSTSGLAAVGNVVGGGTAVAGGFQYQINNFDTTVLSGPRKIVTGGIFTFGSSSANMTGGTATVTSIVGVIDTYTINPLLAGFAGLSGGAETAGRFSPTGGLSGNTTGNDVINARPYLTIPFNGDSATAGGYIETGVGMSFGTSATAGAGATSFGYYGVNAYGGSTLNFPGATAYIKVIANDPNFTQNLTFSLPTSTTVNPQQIALGNTGIAVFQGSALVNGEIPRGVYEAFFGPTATVNNNIAIIRVCKGGATANQTYRATVQVVDNSAAGLTALSTFAISFGATA